MLRGLTDQYVIAGVHLFTGSVLLSGCCTDVLAVWFLWLPSGDSRVLNVHVNEQNVSKQSANSICS
jgi:hypothetical protein